MKIITKESKNAFKKNGKMNNTMIYDGGAIVSK